ncbi:hypothetical protein HK103_006918 [Boothiomyces macroporosus]|uniref:methylated diphthine methylhydrolase n=1 Tax=Boothiomyces macroporosus TaxID=261099 RepID=A0AAD5YAF3_9FUNG|nr:hypothetical protein HK103_006918 [Boothiomyces macroporosus]
MTETILHSLDTVYSADSVEFCPIPDYQQYCAIGTYQVLEQEKEKETNRTGKFMIHQTDDEFTNVFSQNTSAILDMKWSFQLIGGKPCLAIVTATGDTVLYQLDQDGKALEYQSLNNRKNVLNLAVDWKNRFGGDTGLAVSQSDGNISLLSSTPSGLVELEEWNAHDLEAWTVGFNYHDTSVLYTGGDDCMFKIWDIRDLNSPSLVNKKHSAGVTTVACHPSKNLILTGSYDDHIRVWDPRSMYTPVSTIHTGGGVWRLRFDPNDHTRILAACMYNGFHIYSMDGNIFLMQNHSICH